jgi:F0F1-type ATP synthase assembly protein I
MAMPLRSKASAEAEELRLGWRMAGLAFTMSSEVAAGALLGWLIDWLTGAPGNRWLLIGALVGIAVGMWSFIKGALRLNRLLTQQERAGIKRIPPPLPSPPEDEEAENEQEQEKD